MSLSQSSLKRFPIKVQLTVFGFIRETQAGFNVVDNPYYNIPFGINHICLTFYYSNIGWDSNKCSDGLVISGLQDDTVTVHSTSTDGYTVYHKHWYHSQLKGFVNFKIQVGQLSDEGDGYFGFASCDNIINGRFYSEPEKPNYALQGNDSLWCKFEVEDDSIVDENGDTLEQGDQATFTLNLSESKIYFAKNGGEKKAIFENIESGNDIKYKFAITFFYPHPGDNVTITDVEDFTHSM